MNFQMCKRAVKTSYAKADGQVITDLPAYLIGNTGKQICLASYREAGMNASKNIHRKLYASVPTQGRKCVTAYQRNNAPTHLPVHRLAQI